MKPTKRRDLLRNVAIGAVGAVGGVAAACSSEPGSDTGAGAPAVAKEQVTWRLASSFPRGLDTIYGAAEVLAAHVRAMSGGRFRIRTYPAGELVPGLQVLDAVQQGTVQVGQTASYYYTGKNPAFAFDTAVPFGLAARQQIAWLLEAGGRDLLAPLFADFNIRVFYGGSTGAQMGGWFRRPIERVEDIRGLKMRIPGPGGDVMSRLGATVQVLAGGDIYPALERGAIDATEWIGPYDDEKLGFHKVARYYYYPGWWEAGPALSFYVNQSAWDTLSAEFKAIFEAASTAAGTTMLARYDAQNPQALTRLQNAGVVLSPFSEPIMNAAREVSEVVLEEHAEADPAFRRIYDAWLGFRRASFDWFATAERAYADFSFRAPR